MDTITRNPEDARSSLLAQDQGRVPSAGMSAEPSLPRSPWREGRGREPRSWAQGLGRVPGGEAVCRAVCRAWVWESAAAFGGVAMGRQEARRSGLR